MTFNKTSIPDNISIDIKCINESTFLHMCPIWALPNIKKNGLEPKLGKNSIICEDTPKVFFSTGPSGVLECWNAFIKTFIYTQLRSSLLKNSPEKIDELRKAVIDGSFLSFDKRVNENYYEFLYDEFHTSTYLTLSIKDGDEFFDRSAIDEAKKNALRSKSPLVVKMCESMYGTWKNGDQGMEDWNLHTRPGKGVPPQKLKLVTKDGKGVTAWELVKTFYKQRIEGIKLEALDEFMKWANTKETCEQKNLKNKE